MTATWPKDTQAARNAFYGDPGKGQIASQMVPVIPPFKMFYEGTPVKTILFHKKAAPALLAALNEIWDYCQHDQARIDAAGVSKYAGAYNHRMVRGSSTKWSNHAYAAAIDLNAEDNGLYAKGNMPQFVIDAFCRQGWMWGGWYTGRKDPMHFEAVDNGGRKPTTARPVFGSAVSDVPTPTVKIGVVTSNGLNVRSQAAASSSIVRVLAKGISVTVTGEVMNGDTKWLAIGDGYVAARYVDL